MTDNDFQNMIEKGVTLIHFCAAWCPPCRTQKPILKDIGKKYNHQVKISELPIDDNRRIATLHMVHSIPTLIIFKNGGEFRRLVGLKSGKEISGVLETALQTQPEFGEGDTNHWVTVEGTR